MKGEYLWNTGGHLADVRLIIEGALVLYEEDADPLLKLARDSGAHLAANAFDIIGTALYTLREHIRQMNEEHMHEVMRTTAEDA